MTHPNDSRRPRRIRQQCTAAALVLLASVGWAQQVSARDPRSGGSAASGKIGAGQVNALAIDPDTPTTLYAGTECSGVLKSLDGGDSWSATSTAMPHTYVRALAINPATPTTLYAGTFGVFRSTDGGSSWQATDLTGSSVSALAIDPTTPSTLYAGTWWDGLFRSVNGGSSWQATGLTNPYVRALAIDPTTPTTLYAGTYDGGVFRSTNGGSSWSAVNTGLTNAAVLALAINPTTLYAGTYQEGVFQSTNGGNSWQATGLGDVICGDGLAGCGEQCDDGNTVNGDGCDATCRREFCGDAIVQGGLGEECDDGNRNPFDGCTNDCTVCGDGVVTSPEECDARNASSGDDCDAQCRRPRAVGTGTPQSCTERAFEAALAERSVRFNCGPDPTTITLTSEKVITAPTSIDGGGRVTLSGGGAVRIFTIDSEQVMMSALTIRNGNSGSHGDGGGISIINDGTLTLTNCTLRDNSAGIGGGIANFESTVTLTECTLSGNSAVIGGGMANLGGMLTLTNCTLKGNSADDNGSNGLDGRGGGIANFSGTLTVTNSTLSANSAARGGGGIASIINCQDIACSECGSIVVTNSTFSGNGADTGAGGIDGPCPVSLTNSIVASSSGAKCSAGIGAGIVDGGHNLQFPGTDCGATIPSLDPKLDPAGLTDNGGPTQTIALLPDSPAINAGDPDVCANPPVNGVDQRGFVRPGTGYANCSIGAYEYNSPGPPPSCVGDCGNDGQVTIDELLTMVNIALGNMGMAECEAGDDNDDSQITIDEILRAVDRALNGCA
jgi:cysteine-rich repeat protein